MEESVVLFRAATDAGRLSLTEDYESGMQQAGKAGFATVASEDLYGESEAALITHLYQNDYALQNLDWYEEDAPVIGRFAAFAAGRLMAQRVMGEMSQLTYRQNSALLLGIILLHLEIICGTPATT